MGDPPVPVSFFDALRDLTAWLDDVNVPCVIIGGIAASILGRPRATRDVDVLVLLPEERWEELVSSGRPFGFEPRIDDPLEFATRTRVLLLRHRPTTLEIDVSLGGLAFEEEVVARRVPKQIQGLSLPLASPEDLLIMKAVAHRPRDIADIEALLQVHEGLDLDRVQAWLRQFSAALDKPEILDDFLEIQRRRFQ